MNTHLKDKGANKNTLKVPIFELAQFHLPPEFFKNCGDKKTFTTISAKKPDRMEFVQFLHQAGGEK